LKDIDSRDVIIFAGLILATIGMALAFGIGISLTICGAAVALIGLFGR
jgi:hypothetical protein